MVMNPLPPRGSGTLTTHKNGRVEQREVETPDHSTCLNCRQPITFDDWCYIHDDSGMADCGLTRVETGNALPEPFESWRGEFGERLIEVTFVPEEGVEKHGTAVPIEWKDR
jgi:hypothetical protein